MSKTAALAAVLLAFACAGSRPGGEEETKEQPTGAEPIVVPSGWPPSVFAVRGDRVAISAGSEYKVRVGDCFNISRGSRHVGKVSIAVVYEHHCVGVFDTAHAGGAAPPEAGDRAFPCDPD